MFDDPFVEFPGFVVPVFDGKALDVPEHDPVTVLLFGGWFGVPVVVWVGFGVGVDFRPGETRFGLSQLMSRIRWDGFETKMACRVPMRGGRLSLRRRGNRVPGL